MDRSRLCFKKRLRRPRGGCVKGAGGGNVQITQGSNRSTCHRRCWSCWFITVATSTAGHIDCLLWRAALHQTTSCSAGALCVPRSVTAAAPAPGIEGSAGAQQMSPSGPVKEWLILGSRQPFWQLQSQLQWGLVFGMIIYIQDLLTELSGQFE